MPRYQKCDASVIQMAAQIISEFESHHPLSEVKATIDYVFAFCDRDEHGARLNDAIKHHGHAAFGLARIIGLKDRTMGRGDAEVLLDGDWWMDAPEEQQRALLDHELHHITPKKVKFQYRFDDLGRPLIRMRPHDYEFGWFKCIAERHGQNSMERIQAQTLLDDAGQYFWPGLAKAIAA